MTVNDILEIREVVDSGHLRHVAITADGNGRWATARGVPRLEGHVESKKAFESVLTACVELGLPYLSIHVFSPENWRRSTQEVDSIMGLFTQVLPDSIKLFNRLGVRFLWAGSQRQMPERLLKQLSATECGTSTNNRLTLQFCLNYGGRLELLEAVQAACGHAVNGHIVAETLDEGAFREYFYAPDVPDVDLYIRPGGEFRFSNFLIWQAAYAELVFSQKLWPEFRREDLLSAIREFLVRRRTFGTA
jgi:undecaprenyl diphosphate synthase